MSNYTLGQRIKEIRLKNGMNQTEFGKIFNPPAPKNDVSNWEHGICWPNKKRLARIADFNEISVKGLIGGSYLTKEQRDCPYCHDGDTAYILDDDWIDLSFFNGQFLLDSDYANYKLPFKYCPMCGRPLGDNNEEED